MKKSMLIVATALSMVAFASCSGKKENKEATPATQTETAKVVSYVGELPAADADSYNYTLNLTHNNEGNGGTYQVTETTVKKDSTYTFKSEGNFTVAPVEDKTYIKLYSDSINVATTFLVDSDSTLTMVNTETLEVPATPDYTLSIVK